MNKKPPQGLHNQESPENADLSPAMALIRAQARARLQFRGEGLPPDLEVNFVEGLEEAEDATEVPRLADSRRATWGEKEWRRLDGETLTEFQARVWDEVPIGGAFPMLIVFWGDGDATNTQPQA